MKLIEETLRLLGHEKVLGILLNAVEGLNRLYSKYYGYYGSNSSSSTAPRPDKRNESTRRQTIQPKSSNIIRIER